MARKWVVAAIVLAVLFAGAYLGSPFWAARQLRAAAMSGDVDRIEATVDFPAVRDSLTSQLTIALTKRMDESPEMQDNPFAGLGAILMPTIVQRVVNVYVTPDGIAAIMKQGELKKRDGRSQKADLSYDYEWRSLDRFAVIVRGKDVPADRAPAIVFERRGIFSWKMIRLQLPDDMLKVN